MRLLLLVVMCVTLMGCPLTKPQLPKETYIVVEKYKPLPDWATRPYQMPQPADGTVGERTKSNEARGTLLEILFCHRRLLSLLDKGEKVDEKECDQQ